VPLSVWALNTQTQLGIFEAGISQTGEMARLQQIIQPNIGIITNLGNAHQEGFESLKQKCEEKLLLFKNAEIVIYCSDNELIEECIRESKMKAKLFSWGKNKKSDLQSLSVQKENVTVLKLKYNEKEFSVVIPFSDAASIENAMHCISAMLVLNYQTDEIARRTALLEPVALRLDVKKGLFNCLIINDSYNSDLDALAISLDFLNTQATAKNLQRVVVISDILQSGLTAENLYHQVNELLIVKNIQYIIGIGTEISACSNKFSIAQKDFFANTEDFLHSALIQSFKDVAILLKGARKFHFEDISRLFEASANETVMEVNLNALADNLNYFRAKLHPETKIISMVKAFAYGSGAVEVARTLQHHHVDYLAVAVADEGAELRRAGIRIPIMVMNPEKTAFREIFDYALEPEIYTFRLLDDFAANAERLGIIDYPVHIKIDSGMHRLGFEPKDMYKLTEKLKNQNQLKIRSVFSHLAAADDTNFDEFTHLQIDIFMACANKISDAFPHKILRHILNSAAIERFPDYQMDMVRLGIGHYGISTLSNINLKTVCTLKTIILQIKTVKKGETVGYGRKGLITRDSRIAILPIGYADGYNRKIGNGAGEVFINGQRAKTVGNICMDLTMVDVTNISVNEGDTVEIFGENIKISELAAHIGTIPYEILTSVSQRVKRIYFQE
jgi:alanine racemase